MRTSPGVSFGTGTISDTHGVGPVTGSVLVLKLVLDGLDRLVDVQLDLVSVEAADATSEERRKHGAPFVVGVLIWSLSLYCSYLSDYAKCSRRCVREQISAGASRHDELDVLKCVAHHHTRCKLAERGDWRRRVVSEKRGGASRQCWSCEKLEECRLVHDVALGARVDGDRNVRAAYQDGDHRHERRQPLAHDVDCRSPRRMNLLVIVRVAVPALLFVVVARRVNVANGRRVLRAVTLLLSIVVVEHRLWNAVCGRLMSLSAAAAAQAQVVEVSCRATLAASVCVRLAR